MEQARVGTYFSFRFYPTRRRSGPDRSDWSMGVATGLYRSSGVAGRSSNRVNVSPAQLKSRHLVTAVADALAASGLRTSRLELEITESAVLEDGSGAFTTLDQLHALGVRLALDDFGTGYSSLTSLLKFPFHKIKIDRSFVSDMSAESADSLAIVRSVAGLGVSLGMATTVEAVETQARLDHVCTMGCNEIQGYLFSPPRPAHEILRVIQDDRNKTKAAA
jgi:EAL domain-containing protein (putative c-di-GMP-specific phosphodiesterase class I)